MHQMSRCWFEVTKDSFVVDVRKVYDVDGAAWYLAKYLLKNMYGGKRLQLQERGYSRRYMASAKWPRGGQMKRVGTVMRLWVGNSFQYGDFGVDQEFLDWSEKQPLMEQVGTNMAKKAIEAMKFKKAKRLVGAFKNASDVP